MTGRILGLIVEYNPLHNGHIYHIEKAKELVNPDYTIAVMSGHFMQRGEPSVIDKWTRARWALASGMDLVVEIPVAFSLQSAPYFAKGATSLLERLIPDGTLVFGSEEGDINTLTELASLIEKKKETFKSSPDKLFPEELENFILNSVDEEEKRKYSGILSKSNNILGVNYIISLQGSSWKTKTIKRVISDYKEREIKHEKIASATSLRCALEKGENISDLVPEYVNRDLERGNPVFQKDFYSLWIFALNSMNKSLSFFQGKGGIINHLKKVISQGLKFEEFMKKIQVKQYTLTRLQRMLWYVILDFKEGENQEFIEKGPLYARILGYRKSRESLLRVIKKTSSIPLIYDISKANTILKKYYGNKKQLMNIAINQINLDKRATLLYYLPQLNENPEYLNQDYAMKCVVI
ncbi:MAG: nucleotidyltransferase family protein [Candidatus Coatesbacteria bacterium]|nr:nucleotidyltransferase family protein [Candidatus Coatesbacteria bacterium]